MRVELMRILVQVIDAVGVETAGSALDAMNGITFFEQQFRQIAAVLAGDTGYQCSFAVAHGRIVTCRRFVFHRLHPACDLPMALSGATFAELKALCQGFQPCPSFSFERIWKAVVVDNFDVVSFVAELRFWT